MHKYGRLLIALFIFFSGAALMPYVSLPDEQFSWQLFADAYEDEPGLSINHDTGQPGSFFTVSGENFPANSQATITLNGMNLGMVQTDSNGEFVFELDTTGADEGTYFVTATAAPSAGATTRFVLSGSAPNQWPSVGAGRSFSVPPGIGLTEFIYLPTIFR